MYKCDKCGKPIEVIAIYYRTHPKFVRYCYDCHIAEQEERKRQRREEEAREQVSRQRSYMAAKVRNLLRMGIKPKDVAYAYDLTIEEVMRYDREG